MIEPISMAAATAIAKIALDKFIEGGAGELGKKVTEGATQKIQELAQTVVGWVEKSNPQSAQNVLKAAETGSGQTEKLAKYLNEQWAKYPEFAKEVQKLAQEIHVELTQIEDNSSMSVTNYGGTNTIYQTKTGTDNTNYFGGTHNHGK
ncbi:MAG: hypothetical protein SWY16_21470 [Cyanobacteriota bacterium]|nr:hypothetical protein [Cyanobacteriota bacterium]